MAHRRTTLQPVINPEQFGISFSLKQCRAFKVPTHDALTWLLTKGWRRFRLMSYWDEHEKQPGVYDFTALDAQIKTITNAGGIITLCLGAKQPRWPEYHWPKWALRLAPNERDEALLCYIRTVVNRYKDVPSIMSWQLENEALLRGFGSNIHIDRRRLRAEYRLVKQLDVDRPIIMSTSNGWGIPVRSPRPNIIGFSFYPIMFKNGTYHATIQKPWLHRFRKRLIWQPVFIHELQCEPWGPTAIWKMSTEQQADSMSSTQIIHNIKSARRIKAYPIDLWGAEWWFWRHTHHDNSIWEAVEEAILSQ